jgi:hypothetical protein
MENITNKPLNLESDMKPESDEVKQQREAAQAQALAAKVPESGALQIGWEDLLGGQTPVSKYVSVKTSVTGAVKTVALLPRTAKAGKASLASITGLEGDALDKAQAEAEEQLHKMGIADLMATIGNGGKCFKVAHNVKNGRRTYQLRPQFEAEDAIIAKLAKAHGVDVAVIKTMITGLKPVKTIEVQSAPVAPAAAAPAAPAPAAPAAPAKPQPQADQKKK